MSYILRQLFWQCITLKVLKIYLIFLKQQGQKIYNGSQNLITTHKIRLFHMQLVLAELVYPFEILVHVFQCIKTHTFTGCTKKLVLIRMKQKLLKKPLHVPTFRRNKLCLNIFKQLACFSIFLCGIYLSIICGYFV